MACAFFRTQNGCRAGIHCRFSHLSMAKPCMSKPCRNFFSPNGCSFGSNCWFLHGQFHEPLGSNLAPLVSVVQQDGVSVSMEEKNVDPTPSMYSNFSDDFCVEEDFSSSFPLILDSDSVPCTSCDEKEDSLVFSESKSKSHINELGANEATQSADSVAKSGSSRRWLDILAILLQLQLLLPWNINQDLDVITHCLATSNFLKDFRCLVFKYLKLLAVQIRKNARRVIKSEEIELWDAKFNKYHSFDDPDLVWQYLNFMNGLLIYKDSAASSAQVRRQFGEQSGGKSAGCLGVGESNLALPL